MVVPGLGFRKEVLLPPDHIRWAISQPEAGLSVPAAMIDVNQATYSLGHAGPVLDGWQGMLVKTELNRALETLCEALDDELIFAFDSHFGTDTTSWRELDLLATLAKVIAQAGARFTVGLPVCRDPAYVQSVLDINHLLISTGSILSGIPIFLRPILGPLLGLPMRFRLHRIEKWLVPLWKQRVGLVQRAQKGEQDSSDAGLEEEDYVLMMARYAVHNRPEEVDNLFLIVRRICAQNFGSVHQTSIQATNLLLNILGSDAEFNTIAALREESTRILNTPIGDDAAAAAPKAAGNRRPAAGRWTKARVNRMVLADSASRETLRLHSFGNRALFRKVMVPDLTTPGGHVLPKGTIVSFLTWSAQTDPHTHADPLTYDPFRFVRGAASAEDGEKKTRNFVTTAPDFLPFGHGKHACPGRFLVDFELKMIIAHVLRHYDVRFPDEYRGKRPPNRWVAEACFPPAGVRVCVRRREKPYGAE